MRSIQLQLALATIPIRELLADILLALLSIGLVQRPGHHDRILLEAHHSSFRSIEFFL